MSSAGVGPLCFLKSIVNAAIYQEILEHFMLPSADKLYGEADFIFQQDLASAHTVKGTKSWFNDHGVTVLDWPANSPDLNGIVKRKMRDTRPNTADELKAAIKETWASIPPQQCHKLITSMPRRIEAVIKGKRHCFSIFQYVLPSTSPVLPSQSLHIIALARGSTMLAFSLAPFIS